MKLNQHAIVGIAGHYEKSNRRGAWAVVIRIDEEDLLLHGVHGRAGVRECERHAVQQAMSALRRQRVPLKAIEVTYEVKRALTANAPGSQALRGWAAARGWWKTIGTGAGLRVTRKTADAQSAASRIAEITALSGAEKLRLSNEELDTPWNRRHQANLAEERADRLAARLEREQRHQRQEINEYGIATGRDSIPDNYRRRPARRAVTTTLPRESVPQPRGLAPVNDTAGLDAMLDLLNVADAACPA